ncbi:BAHD acyltransferase BIA1-like [Brassica rapa]|uniref:BAHD acyltransferase n=1 Tax=Brassica campestris TaxID=3711 RepID=M4FAH2_BRACM|nr:BAHD acyltransferase BIA1-like [Brassica rapa]
MEMKLEVVGREVIKPASPSPQDLLQLSLADVSGPAAYVSTIFFYKTVSGESLDITSGRLKTSLSDTLSRFYPLAGRMEGDKIICNDEGAVFTEARTDLLLSDFLKNNLDNTNSLPEFLPTIAPGESAGAWPLLSAKVSFFGSGSGFAVTVSISHRICDASSILTFVSGWAATAKAESSDVVVMNIPTFASTTIYPPPPCSFQSSSLDGLYEPKSKCVANRFFFKSSKIAELKRRAMSETVPVPTRVEVIMSLIWRCATNSSRSNSAVQKSTLMIQALDLRLRIPPAVLSKDAVGNLQAPFFLKEGSESKMEIAEIVAEFRKAKEVVNEMIKENLATTTLGPNLLSLLGKLASELTPDIDLFPMSSWCRKPFYEVDFGCGSPVWIGSTGHVIHNAVFVMLMDSKDGEDVEAWISLPGQDMSVFVRDQEVLAYAVINPPVLI